MKIGIVVRTLVSNDAVSNDAVLMFQYFNAWGFDARLYCEYSAIETISVRALPDIWQDVPDLVVYHMSNGWSHAINELATFEGPIIIRYHNVTPPELFVATRDMWNLWLTFQGRLQTAQLPQLIPQALYWADSRYNARELIAIGVDPQMIEVMPPLIPARRWNCGTCPPASERSGVLFVGRFSPNKGHLHLLRVWKALLETGPKETAPLLNMAGKFDPDGSYERRLVRMIEDFGLADYVMIHNYPSDLELDQLYRSNAVYLSLSVHEGFGLPLMEAMAYELPVMAYGAGAVPEILGEAGIVIEEMDYQKVAEQVRVLAGDPMARETIARWQKAHVTTAYDQERTLYRMKGHLLLSLQKGGI